MRMTVHAALFAASVGFASAEYPMPELQTAAQQEAFTTKRLQAKAASDAATPEVLAFFDSSEFREAMKDCCPRVAAMSSDDILGWFNSEALVSELAHAFPASSNGGHFTDGNLDTITSFGWFLNEWQGEIIGGSTSTSKATQNGAAVKLFGLPESPDLGFTWSQAADRMIYVAQNFYQVDTGSNPNFGDVSAIFSSSYVKDMVLIAPVDTGRWHMSGCDPESPVTDLAGPRPPRHSENCSAWDPQVVGTLEYHNHMILPNFNHNVNQSAGGTITKAQAFFSRSSLAGAYEVLPAVSSNDYWESNIVGHPRLPEGVKFLVGNFPTLFGTELGRKLQQVCDHYSWPLVWAFGYGSSGKASTVLGNKRILDPTDAALHTNATLANAAVEAFEQAWSSVEAARSGGTPTAAQFGAWWAALEESQTRLAPMTGSSCADQECIGTVVASGECICRPAQSITV